MRESGFTCIKDFGTFTLQRLIVTCTVYAMLLLPILYSASSSYAEEPKVFTDADLVNYNAEPMVDQETLSSMEDDMKLYEKKKDAEFLLEREKRKRQQAEEAKKTALQKQDVTISRTPVSIQKRNKMLCHARLFPFKKAVITLV